MPSTLCDRYTMNDMTSRAPLMAASVMAELPMMPKLERAVPPRAPLSSTTNATPRLAALDTPSTDGPARGLRKTVCISRPATERPAPHAMAVTVCGRRVYMTMLVHISAFSPRRGVVSKGLRIENTAAAGMPTEPTARFMTARTAMLRMSTSIIEECRI